MRLKTKIIVDSLRFVPEQQGIQVYIERKGNADAGAIFVKHDNGQGLYDVYHSVNDYKKKKIKFLNTFTKEKLDDFFKRQIDIDADLWLVEVVSKGFDLDTLLLKQGL